MSEKVNHQKPTQFDAGIAPVLAGAALIQGGVLTLRAKDEELTIKAPAKFLRALFHWCDGSKTRAELASMAETKWPASRFGGFMDAMLEAGVLVDHRFVADRLLQERRMQRPYQKAAPGGFEVSLPQGGDIELAVPRHSGAAEAGPAGVLSLGALANLLAVAPQAEGPAGLRFVVFFRENLGVVEAGTYEVHWAAAGAFLRPFGKAATAVSYEAFPNLYDFFRSQALLAIFAESNLPDCPLDVALVTGGAALQRLASAATASGIAHVEAGAAYGQAVSALCGPDKHLFIAATFLGGVPPRHGGIGNPALLKPMVRIIDRGEAGGDYLAAAQVERDGGANLTGWGRSVDVKVACAKALSEAVERHAYREPPAGLLLKKGCELAGKLNPTELIRFSERQYRDKASLGIRPYSDDAERFWVEANCLGSDEKLLVPADCVFSGANLPRASEFGMLMRQTSSGCASDVSLDVAIERAGLEVIERDAFVRHWLAQRPGRLVAPGSLPAGIQAKARGWEARGCTLRIGVFAGEWGPVIFIAIASAVHQFSVIAASCFGSMDASITHALSEAETIGLLSVKSGPPKRLAPKAVQTPADHGLLFRQPAHYLKTAAITEGGDVVSFAELQATWPATLAQRLQAAPRPPKAVWVDLTQRAAPESLDGQVIRSVRVLIPGAIPIGFGYDGLPLGMDEKIAPGGKFPHPFN